MTCRIGIDIGGTFTDFALFDDTSRAMAIHKQLTTPADPSRAVLDGISTILEANRADVADVDTVVHGTTLVTNAVIERKGAVTGMLATAGFSDIPDMVMTPLDIDQAKAAVRRLVEEHDVEALAVCLLHAYANPAHESAIKEMVARDFPGLYVSVSSEVFPEIREYERWTTTMINAYTQPMFDRYLARIEAGLAALGFRGRFYMMASNGGTVTADLARRFPVRMMESGPAAGALMSAHHGKALALPDALSFDMGGTTAKGALVRGHAPLKKYEIEVARVDAFKKGSGLLVKIPVIDMIEIGAGGGSIAEADERGLIRVGPRSAGADPGPACYGRGGPWATLTDANVVLGYLDPDYFLGGEMRLDGRAAARAIAEHVAEPLDLTLTRAAWGVHEIVDEDVARAFRIHASERGFDYRGCSMVAFGGSGPVHAAGVARKLGMRRVVFPLAAGVMSAFGLLASPLAFEVVRSDLVFVDDLGDDWYDIHIAPLVDEAADHLRRAGIAAPDIDFGLRLDMRYHGQGHEVEVRLPATDDMAGLGNAPGNALVDLFERRYAEVFSETFPQASIEIINWKVEATGPPTAAARGYAIAGTAGGDAAASVEAARKATRQAYFREAADYVAAPVYERMTLVPGAEVRGPALIEERESTCVIGPGDVARVDAHHNLVVELRPEALTETDEEEEAAAAAA
jgi:N-methylhydantoinase A